MGVRQETCETSAPSPTQKLTKAQAMARVRASIRNFAKTYCLDDESGLQFVEGVNQLSFENDNRFEDENIISGYSEMVSSVRTHNARTHARTHAPPVSHRHIITCTVIPKTTTTHTPLRAHMHTDTHTLNPIIPS